MLTISIYFLSLTLTLTLILSFSPFLYLRIHDRVQLKNNSLKRDYVMCQVSWSRSIRWQFFFSYACVHFHLFSFVLCVWCNFLNIFIVFKNIWLGLTWPEELRSYGRHLVWRLSYVRVDVPTQWINRRNNLIYISVRDYYYCDQFFFIHIRTHIRYKFKQNFVCW